jgi:rhodanese-related sulfurtransferase
MPPERIDTHDARRLLDAGAQAIEVLPASDFAAEHLPGAISLPLPQLTAESVGALDHARPTIVYCFDTQCDLSGRGAARLVQLGFDEVYDYTGSKVAWLAMGWPYDGSVDVSIRAGAIARMPATCAPDTPLDEVPEAGHAGVVIVVDAQNIVLGAVEGRAVPKTGGLDAFDVAAPAPTSVRPSITADELAGSMDDAGESHVLVTTLEGTLLGVVERDWLHVDR